MRALTLAVLMTAALTLPAMAGPKPVKGAVQGTVQAGKGVGSGAVQAGKGVGKGAVRAGRGVARGGRTAGRGIFRGARCIVSLGRRC